MDEHHMNELYSSCENDVHDRHDLCITLIKSIETILKIFKKY